MPKYKIHKAYKPRKISYKIPHGVSKEETEVLNMIAVEFPRIQVFRSNREILHGKEIDIWIPSRKLGVEFNGNRYHSSAMDKTENYHLNKTIMAEKQQVRLLHIFSDMWELKKAIVIDHIRKLLGKYQEIDIKDCKIEKLTPKEGQYFLDNSTLNGIDYRSTDYLSILYNGYIVAVLEYSKDAIYGYHEIKGIKIKNGLESILNYDNKLTKLKVYCDRGLLENIEWEFIGYKQIDCTKPRLYYTKDFKERILNESRKLTESQKKSMYTIYDCGELILKKLPK